MNKIQQKKYILFFFYMYMNKIEQANWPIAGLIIWTHEHGTVGWPIGAIFHFSPSERLIYERFYVGKNNLLQFFFFCYSFV